MLVHGWPTEKIPPLNDQISLEAQLYNYTTKKRQISVLFCFFKLFFFSPASCHIFCCYIDDWIYSDSSCRRKTLERLNRLYQIFIRWLLCLNAC